MYRCCWCPIIVLYTIMYLPYPTPPTEETKHGQLRKYK